MTNGHTRDETHVFSHDDFAWQLASHLLEDFKPFVASAFYDTAKAALAARSVGSWRALTCGMNEFPQPYQLKTTYQMTNLFKKFSFSQDLYTPTDLIKESTKKFMDNQNRLSNFRIDKSDPVIRDILFSTRGYVDQILGDFTSLEICERATFGKKSSVGIPMRKACEGERYEAPITGSDAQIEWFDKYFGAWNRPALEYAKSRAHLRKKDLYRSVDILEAVLVPKTWKSLRMIMPNTTIGTLYSSGLGRTLEERLRCFGYDIRKLQPVHGELAKIGSITGSLVTADQSMASDNITVQLIDEVFPYRWAQALKFGRIEEITLNGVRTFTPTFSTMGIGFTFPLQTLVFLSLLLAIRDHCGLDEHTVISVFGDDLIYDYRMHETVMSVFPAIGLLINADKTFADGKFRESCGYDYYAGADVRPFLLGRGSQATAGKRRSEAYLYTVLNGLLRRWEVYEVPLASKFIVEEIRRVRKDDPLVVPTDYPDTSGAKLSDENTMLLGLLPRRKRDVHGVFSFRYLAFEPGLKEEHRHEPYYFQSLRRESSVVSSSPFTGDALLLKRGVGDMIDVATEPFTVLNHKDRRCSPKLPKERRLRPRITHITEQDVGRYRERSGVTSNWTPEVQSSL